MDIQPISDPSEFPLDSRSDTIEFYESVPFGKEEILSKTMLHCGGKQLPTYFFHRGHADLLDIIVSMRGQLCRSLSNPTKFKIFDCQDLSQIETNATSQYAYYSLEWSKSGSIVGYTTPEIFDEIQDGFYSTSESEYIINVGDCDTNGKMLSAEITPQFTLQLEPSRLSSFLRCFLVNSSLNTMFQDPSLSPFFIHGNPYSFALNGELNLALHEYPWTRMKPMPPKRRKSQPTDEFFKVNCL